MSLEAQVRLQLGALSLNAQLTASSGEVVAILGPNGSGKTTLLRALAGSIPLTEGRIVLDGEVLEDTAAGIRLPSEKRPVGVVFQDYLLFPHLSVLENVAFGLRARGADKAAAREKAREWLERFGLTDYARRRPSALSGGQAQRVALARALATEPHLLLLDEPMAALDAGSRVEVRRELRKHLASFQGVRLLVTHNPLEAAALADRLVVLEEGRVVQEGRFPEVAEHPRSSYVAELVGLNLFRGKAGEGRVDLDPQGCLIVAAAISGEVFVAIHPRAVALHRHRPEGSPRNNWQGEIDGVDLEQDRVRVKVTSEITIVAEVTVAAAAELDLSAGGPIWVSVKATEIAAYPA
jgi:molybdate transport system ATP-binding protein